MTFLCPQNNMQVTVTPTVDTKGTTALYGYETYLSLIILIKIDSFYHGIVAAEVGAHTHAF